MRIKGRKWKPSGLLETCLLAHSLLLFVENLATASYLAALTPTSPPHISYKKWWVIMLLQCKVTFFSSCVNARYIYLYRYRYAYMVGLWIKGKLQNPSVSLNTAAGNEATTFTTANGALYLLKRLYVQAAAATPQFVWLHNETHKIPCRKCPR